MSPTSINITAFLCFSFFLLTFCTSPALSRTMKCHPRDRQVLLKIKQGFNNPQDLGYSWIPNTDCCDWYGVECNPNTNHVTRFHLAYVDISSQIPDAIGDLSFLEFLSLHKLPNLTGTIPSSIAALTHLTFLEISWTNITGPIPSFLSQLQNLTFLDLSFNNLTGSIPPSLSQLRNLGGLRLDRNRLTGPIPDTFSNITPSLQYLYLSHNQLSGTVPKGWANSQFVIMQFQNNRLEGDISFLFGKNKTVAEVDFSRNMLQFNLSEVAFPVRLATLYLNHNRIYGKLPEDLTGLEYLMNLNMSYNRLCGQVPVGGRLDQFDFTAYFHNQCLCGVPLPNCTRRSL